MRKKHERPLNQSRTPSFLIILCLVLGGCTSDWDIQMNNLRDDPLATTKWPELELLGTDQSTQKGHKPTSPRITRCYKRSIGIQEAFEKVISTAKQNDWIEDSMVKSPDTRVARKEIGGSKATLLITSQKNRCTGYSSSDFVITIGYL